MTPREVIDAYADETGQELLCADGFDDAILGVCERFNHTFVVYDETKVLATLEAQGMSVFDATEWFEHNIVGAWVGDATPGYLLPLKQIKERVA